MAALKVPNLAGADSARFKRYRQHLAFYHGEQWPGRALRNEKRLTFNYARVVVDKLASYMMNGLNIKLAGGSDASGQLVQEASRALREVSEWNNLEMLDYESEVDAAILGDGCYRVGWDEEAGRVRVSAPDVQGIHAWWRADDTSRLRQVACRYRLEEESEYYRLAGGRGKEVIEVWTEKACEVWVDDRCVAAGENAYGFIPFIIFPNLREAKSFWGVSDIEALIEPQVELNRAMSQLSHILELSGNPVAVLENVERAEDIAVSPGAVWTLPEDARAYLLDLLQGGGVNLHIGYIEMLYRVLHDTAESPRAAFGGTARDLSGVALEVELQPLLHKVWRKRLIRTPVYRRRAQMILALLDKYTGSRFGDLDVEVLWRPVLPRDFARSVENEEKLVQSGIHSRATAMAELGVTDPAGEFERWCRERRVILEMNRQIK